LKLCYGVTQSLTLRRNDDLDKSSSLTMLVTALVLEDDFEGEDVDVVNVDGFERDTSYDDETGSHRRRRLNELRRDIEEALNDTTQWKYSFYTGQKFDILIKAVQDQLQLDLELWVSMSKAFRDKAKAESEVKYDHTLQYAMLKDYVVES
ncbi:hypothetical protein Tco_1131370, partial [Tanacetum coccineum]